MKYTKLLLTSALLATSLQLANAATITQPGDPIGGGDLDGTTFTIGSTANTLPGSFPAGEAPSNALDGSANTKYLNFGGTNSGYIVTPTIGLSNVTGAIFASADGDDGSKRDPLTFSLYGSNSVTSTGFTTPGTTYNLSSFTAITLDQATGLSGIARFTTAPEQTFLNAVSYATYLLIFPTLVNPPAVMSVGTATLQGIPEPSSLALLGLGALGMVTRRRRNA